MTYDFVKTETKTTFKKELIKTIDMGISLLLLCGMLVLLEGILYLLG